MAITTGAYGTNQMPLAGAILCFTSINPEQRTELSVIGSQMGAQVKLDLTSDVTHLIVGNANSAKYRYVAKAREDVKVVFPGWIHAVQKVWMAGEDVDVRGLEAQWKLPTFYGLKICLTGFDNPDERKQIQETVTGNGAEYHGDLTKAVTHLIAASPSGSKYEHAVNWRMKIVTWEWFEQSHERGMALDEAFYHPTMAVENRGVGAWDRRRRSASPMIGKRMRAAEQTEAVLNPSRRKLRRAASTRFSGQTEALWADITAGSFEQKPNEQDDWSEDNIAPPEPLPDVERTMTVEARVEMPPRMDPAPRTCGPFADDHDGIFAGRVVFLRGFDKSKTNILREHLDGNGAVVVCDPAELSNFTADDLGEGYLLVPHDVQSPDLTALPEAAGAMSLVTNWWVERCLHGKCLVDPTDYVLCRPFDRLSIGGFEHLTINSTGFTGIELLHITKAVALFGASYDEILSPKVSVLICRNDKPNPEKLKYATEKSIPVLHADWLWECMNSGEVQPYGAYLLNTVTSQPQKPKQRPIESSKEIPTARLSKEDSFKLQQKLAQKPKLNSNARSSSRRAGALELSASGPLMPSTAGSSTNHNSTTNHSSLELEHDAQLPGLYDGAAESLLLQDVDPRVNSRKPSTSSTDLTTQPKSKAGTSRSGEDSADTFAKPAPAHRNPRPPRQPSPDSVIPPDTEPPVDAPTEAPIAPPPEKDYSDIMSKLLANRKTTAPVEKDEEKGRRRRRPLGRAQSGRSNTSTTNDDVLSRHSSASKIVEEEKEEMGEHEGNVLEAFKPPQPSQMLGWDSPGAQRAREKMIRAIGGNVAPEAADIQETKVVKDAVSDNSLGMGRARRKRRG